jgi:hypothetical protein
VSEAPTLRQAIPSLRIFSVEKAKEFYVDFLGFTWDWEHRFGDVMKVTDPFGNRLLLPNPPERNSSGGAGRGVRASRRPRTQSRTRPEVARQP